MINLKAFTLAETLITLGIIGIVAAVTLPTLINTIQDKQYRIAWRKQFSVISNTIRSVKEDECSESIQGCFNNRTEIVNAICNHLTCIQKCDQSADEGCWHKVGEFSSPNKYNNHSRNLPGFILKDGTLWSTNTILNTECKPANQWTESAYEGDCFDLSVDINGKAKPNIIGRDIFRVVILEDKTIPYGLAPVGTSSCSTWGDGCSAKYLNP